jgi:hypothetical protein
MAVVSESDAAPKGDNSQNARAQNIKNALHGIHQNKRLKNFNFSRKHPLPKFLARNKAPWPRDFV